MSVLLDIIPVQSAKILSDKGDISVSFETPKAHPAVGLGGFRGPQKRDEVSLLRGGSGCPNGGDEVLSLAKIISQDP